MSLLANKVGHVAAGLPETGGVCAHVFLAGFSEFQLVVLARGGDRTGSGIPFLHTTSKQMFCEPSRNDF